MTRDEHVAKAQEYAEQVDEMRADLRRDMQGGLSAADISASAALIAMVAAEGLLHAQVAQAMASGELADRPQVWPAGSTVVRRDRPGEATSGGISV